jgi:cell division protein YceG involved in septum cleavage
LTTASDRKITIINKKKRENMKKREMTEQVNEWLNGDSIKYLMSTIEAPFDEREEEGVLTDEEYHFAEKALDETVQEMRGYEMSDYDFVQSEQDKKDEFATFFQEVFELFESKIKAKKMTLNYNSEVFS